MKKIGVLCLLIPFVFTTLNIQEFVSLFVSEDSAQLFAYLNLCLVVIGAGIFFKKQQSFVSIINLWICFYFFYFLIGSISTVLRDTPSPFLPAFIPLIYFFGFSIFLSIPLNQKLFLKTALVAFFIATLSVIIFKYLNFSIDTSGIYEYELDRADGVYGDANQAALVSLITFILIYHVFKARSKLQKLLKFLLIIVSVYALILCFSNTGFVVLLAVLGLTFNKLFTLRRFLITILIFPILFIAVIKGALTSESLSRVQKDRIENVVNILTLNTEKVEFSERDILLKRMLNYVFDNPVLGYGIGFSNIIRGHNTIIGVWADAGIVTFLIFILILYQYFKKSWTAPIENRYFALSIVFALTIFMLSLQSIINQSYLMAIFVYIAYLIEPKEYCLEQQ